MSQLCLLRAGASGQGIQATQDWKFAANKTLKSSQGITPTFTRASGASYFDASGVLRWNGLNQCLQSVVNNTTWGAFNETCTPNATTAPDGTTTAALIVENTANNNHYHRQTITLAAGTYTVSVYAKAKERYIVAFGGAATGLKYFNLQNGTIGSTRSGSPSAATITNVGNGWYRLTVTGGAYAGGTGEQVQLLLTNNTETDLYTGDGASGIYSWGAQIELGTDATTYSPTTTTASGAPRFDHVFNATTNLWESRGLLVEEQRTNQAIYSDDLSNAAWARSRLSVAANNAVAPDGTTTADKLTGTTTDAVNNGFTYNSAIITFSGTVLTASIFYKKGNKDFAKVGIYGTGFSNGVEQWFNISSGAVGSSLAVGTNWTKTSASISYAGNGWYRCTLSVSVAGGATTAYMLFAPCINADNANGITTGDYTYAWGAQLEAGSFATSYIPTTSASATRSADVCQVTGTSFSSFWNATEGSFAVEGDRLYGDASTVGFAWSVNDTTTNESINYYTESGFERYLILDGGASQGSLQVAIWPANTVFRSSHRYKLNDLAASYNGGAVLTDTTATIATVTQLQIGNRLNTYYFNGHISRLRYFNKALTDKQLEDLGKPELSKSLDLQFASLKSLTPLVGPTPSYSRASAGWYFNASGVLTQAAIDEPRFDHTYDGANWICRGLLIEEQRTNLLLNSTTLSTQNVTTSATAYTISFYGTGTITLSGTSTAGPLVGTGANNRVTLTFTPTAGTLTLTVTGTVSNAQLEAGAFATSWISTAGTSATRSADVCTITGTNFSGMWNASEFSMIADADCSAVGGSYGLAMADANGSQSWSGLYVFSSAAYVFTDIAGVIQAQINPGVISTGVTFGLAGGFRANNFAGSLNGSAASTDLTGSLPTVDRLRIGSRQDGSYVNGHIGSLQVYTIRLPNRLLVQKSS